VHIPFSFGAYICGGVRGGRNNLLGIIPGGSSIALLPKHICDYVMMAYVALKVVQSGLHKAAVIVMDKFTDVVDTMDGMIVESNHSSCYDLIEQFSTLEFTSNMAAFVTPAIIFCMG
jgi:NADH:ubiquinone oxidoreductase subunit F (NADH-binding)